MPPSKREREAARRRRANHGAASAPRDRARHRQRTIGLIVVGALVVTLGISATLALGGGSPGPSAQEQSALGSETGAVDAGQDTGDLSAEAAATDGPDVAGGVDDGADTADGADDGDGAAGAAPDLVPAPELAEDRTWTGSIDTNRGRIEIELDGAAAPQAVANFVTLADDGFFDDTSCHRLVTAGIYILQCGDPDASGYGGPGYAWGPIENAPADDVYRAGTLAMARVGHDAFSMGSQFFLVYEESQIPSDSAGGYTVFGHITSGLDVVRAIADEGNGDDGVAPKSDVIIEGVQVQ